MTRILCRPVAVYRWNGIEPEAFRDHATDYVVVHVLDRWMEVGRWWLGEGERLMLRVWTAENDLLDLEGEAGQWWIYKIWD